MSDLLLGAHVSAAGGIPNAVTNLSAIGGNVVQLFSASPRTWARQPLEERVYTAYKKAAEEHGIKATVIHAIYLANLASETKESLHKSMEVLMYDMEICAKIGAVGVVVHVGSHTGRGFDAVKEQVIESIHSLVVHSPMEAVFLIENSAGQKGKIGSKLEEVKYLLDELGSKRVGWCLDTCHAHAAGYRLAVGHASPHSTEPFLLDEIERLGLWDALKVVHVNESKDPFFSGRDRHANLGEGEIGNLPLGTFLRDERIKKLPLVLEVPGQEGTGPDTANLEKLRALVEGKA